jgi:MFS family permease
MDQTSDQRVVQRRNAGLHFVEGSLYLASGGILNVQTVYPSLVRRLGGSDIAVGLLPVIAFGAMFLPQILGANYAAHKPFRRSFVLKISMFQRLIILVLGACIGLFAAGMPALSLVVFFVAITLNQLMVGLAGPAWFEFFTKTIPPGTRGRLMGLRSSGGGLLSFLSSIALTLIFVHVPYPHSYALAFAIAFAWQLSSWFVLRSISEEEPSPVQPPLRLKELTARVRDVVGANPLFRRFLWVSALSTVGLLPAAFFTVAALDRFGLEDSAVGLFTAIAVGAQTVSAIALGWLGDRKGYRRALLVCSGAIVVATLLAIVSNDLWLWYPVFALTGMAYGVEVSMRQNFAADCASEHDRPIYIGVLNAWLAPWYLTNIAGGWISGTFGFGVLFLIGLFFALAGFVALLRLKDPHRHPDHGSLALSSN